MRGCKRPESRAALTGGLSRKAYAAALALLALLSPAMAGLLLSAIAVREYASALFVLGFAALFGWQVGGFIRRNQRLSYSFDHIPEKLPP